jgi:hypothetical protein
LARILAVIAIYRRHRPIDLMINKDQFVYSRPPLWSSSQEFLAANPEVPGLIPGATSFSE